MPLEWLRHARPFIHIGHGASAQRVLHLQVHQIEAGQTAKFIYLPIQMTAARHAAPGRSDPVLPILAMKDHSVGIDLLAVARKLCCRRSGAQWQLKIAWPA